MASGLSVMMMSFVCCAHRHSVDETRTMGLRSPSTAQFEQNLMRAAIRTKISRHCDSKISCLGKQYPGSRKSYTQFNEETECSTLEFQDIVTRNKRSRCHNAEVLSDGRSTRIARGRF